MKPTFLWHLLTVPSLRCMNSHPFSWPCFRIIGRNSHGFLGDKRWVFVLLYVFLCAKNNIKYINLTSNHSSTQMSGPIPPPTHKFAAFGSFNRYVVGAGKLEVSKCPSLFILAVFMLNSTTHLLAPRPLSIAGEWSKTTPSSLVGNVRVGEGWVHDK